jgi:hypothetical protein
MKNSTFPHNQLRAVYEYLQNHVATASMVASATGIPQKNICRYKRDLEQQGKLSQLRKSTCKETGFSAWYLSTNPLLFKPSKQLNLF